MHKHFNRKEWSFLCEAWSKAKLKAREEEERKAREKAKIKAEKKTARKARQKRFSRRVLLPVFIMLLLGTGAYFAVTNWSKLAPLFGGKSKTAEALTVEGESFTVNGVTFNMVAVKGGTFEMGSDSGDEDEKPVHSATVGDYMIGETEVTQALWEAVMEDNPSKYKGAERPVHNVSWLDCQAFIKRLNKLVGKNFRLPTEAEWEYAARGGHKSKGIYKYSGSQKAKDVAWHNCRRPHKVKTKLPNELGVYDMSGNIAEWCEDDFDGKYELSKGGKALRGGWYELSDYYCRVSYRNAELPNNGYRSDGFRLVLSW
ncbi:MAG: formylglycine-generating enzyme family protein [Bacteroidales bacterium]|nr:formylglycine-generating enzyme family protein [Bacteroidales bacterium]